MKLNWKYIEYKNKLVFAACRGEKLYREFKDISLAAMFESNNEFSNSINEFLKEQKKLIEAKIQGKHFEKKIERIPNAEFRKQQRKLDEKTK